MDNQNKQTERKKTFITILTSIAVGLVVNGMLKWLGASLPWLLVVSGVVVSMIAVLLAVPKAINYFSPIYICKRIHSALVWWLRGPHWSCPKPILSIDNVNPNNANLRRTNFTTVLLLDIENRDSFPLEVSFYSLEVNIEQGLGRGKVKCLLHPNPSYQDTIEPQKHKPYKLLLFGACNNDRCLDLKKDYKWGIQEVSVSLGGAGYRDLHRGLYHKPIPKSRINFV